MYIKTMGGGLIQLISYRKNKKQIVCSSKCKKNIIVKFNLSMYIKFYIKFCIT